MWIVAYLGNVRLASDLDEQAFGDGMATVGGAVSRRL